MAFLKIAIIREGKIPTDKRAPLSPNQALELQNTFKNVKVVCQQSRVRCFKNEEYSKVGIPVVNDIYDCDIFLGIKEVPVSNLIGGKIYLFFSHTMKKQEHNRKLLQTILKKGIHLIDYEALKDGEGNRLVGFGRYAGIVGSYNALWTYGRRTGSFVLPRAFSCEGLAGLEDALDKIKIPPVKIVLLGSGRVGKGAIELLTRAKIKQIMPRDYLDKDFDFPVFTQLTSKDYHVRKDGGKFDRIEFHEHPHYYQADFKKFGAVSHVLIVGTYWNPEGPKLFSPEDLISPFKIQVIADITCDLDGSIPSTKRASAIDDPVYDYNPYTGEEEPPFSNEKNVNVMAIDNLPCELPRSSSEDFGKNLMEKVLPHLFAEDEVIDRATICRNGKLSGPFSYLNDFVKEKS